MTKRSSNTSWMCTRGYTNILKLGRERQNVIYLDVGACLRDQLIHLDDFLSRATISISKTNAFFLPDQLCRRSALNTNILEIAPPFEEVPSTAIPDLSTLTSLNPLAGHCFVIQVSRFFHVFSEQTQRYLAQALPGLLPPKPGSIICGQHAGEPEKRIMHKEVGGGAYDVFCHSPQSWADLDAKLVWVEANEGLKYWLMSQ
ncbi:hypothetical protein V8E55_001366 [Tylopilus felleus]